MSPVFGYGDMRLYLLKLLDEAPRYGYELIRLLEERFMGAYTPSAGAIYPRLSALEEEGLVEHVEEEGKKVYRLTDAGRRELEERMDEMSDLEHKVSAWAGDVARGIGEALQGAFSGIGGIGGVAGWSSVARDLARDVTRDVRRTQRDTMRAARHARRTARIGHGRFEDDDGGDDGPSLQADLDAFVADVGWASRRNPPDKERLRRVQQILLDTRHAIEDVLEQPRASEAATESTE